MHRFFFLGLILASLAACGGNVVVDGAGTTTGSTSSSTSSTTSVTTTSVTTSTVMDCPAPFPGIEASCGVEGQVCAVPLACCSGTATCAGGFWKYTGVPCAEACTPPCGPDDFACQGGAVCATYIGKTTLYQCAPDPCSPDPLSCACAAPLCALESMVCDNIQMGFKVLCDCQGQC